MNKRFISLEGVEGVGKTTNLAVIERWFQMHDVELLITREPGGTALGESIRTMLLDPANTMQAQTEMLLMAAARVEHVRAVIEPALADGRWVLSDRYLDASLAYQGGGRELGVDTVRSIHTALGITLQPSLTVLLDLDPAESRARIGAREADRIERESDGFFSRVRNTYLALAEAEPQRFCRIDASETIERVAMAIEEVLEQRFGAELDQRAD